MLVAGWNENLIGWLDGEIQTSLSGLADLFADAAEALATHAAARPRETAAPERPASGSAG